VYERLLSATSLLPNDAEDSDEDDARGEEGEDGAGADASIPSVFRWLSKRRRWRVYSSQAIPNCLTVLVQCSVFTVLSFLAANLGAVEIAAHNQNIALLEVAFTFVGGMAEGTSIRVGYHVGKGNVEAAKLVAQIAFCVNTVLGLCVGFIGYYFRRELASCLSSDPAVVDVSVQLAPLLWSTFALFSIGDQALGVLEGQGRATAQAVAFLVGAVGVTIPLALISYFCTDYGLLGLWYALLIGFLLSELIAIVLVVYYSNWQQYTQEATARVNDADGPDEDVWTPLQSKQDAELLDKIIQIKRTTSRDREAERVAGVAFLSGSD
jgi:Na+-driven multidrug efflux pump